MSASLTSFFDRKNVELFFETFFVTLPTIVGGVMVRDYFYGAQLGLAKNGELRRERAESRTELARGHLFTALNRAGTLLSLSACIIGYNAAYNALAPDSRSLYCNVFLPVGVVSLFTAADAIHEQWRNKGTVGKTPLAAVLKPIDRLGSQFTGLVTGSIAGIACFAASYAALVSIGSVLRS